MARVSNMFGFVGNIEGVNFYKTRYGYFARSIAVIAKSRIKNDPEFARTRENNEEFKNAQLSSKLFRETLEPATRNVKVGSSTHKLLSVLCAVRNQDLTNVRGKRKVHMGILSEKGKSILKGFNFNPTGTISPQLLSPFALDTTTGTLSIPGINMRTDFPKPLGADKVGLTLFWSKMNFENLESASAFSPEVTLNLFSDQIQDVALAVGNIPGGIGTNIFLFRVRYYQTIGEGQVMLISPVDSVCIVIGVY